LWLLFCGLPHVNVVVIVADAVLIVLVSLTRLLKLPWQSFSCGTALYLKKKPKKKQAAIGGGMATENIRQICRQSRNLNKQIIIVIGPDRISKMAKGRKEGITAKCIS